MITPILPVYGRTKLAFERGEGVYLYTPDGEAYLDFAAGIAVNALGHGHPHVVSALKNQADKLWHISNLYTIPGMDRLGERFVERSFADTVFFCNSGTEAVECGIKMVRKYHDDTGNPDKFRIITFQGAFHGRTMAAISASNRARVMDGFGPALEGFDNIPFGDLDAVRAALKPETGGILVEPIQGEGGIRPATKEFLQGLRDICDEHGLLLFFDEVQCGMGRTGTLFAHELYGVKPDILASAKGIGAGFPLGACFATEKAAIGMKQGTHGSTYGGNPLAMAVGNAVLDVILEKGFMEGVAKKSQYFMEQLQKTNFPEVLEEVRGKGLMLGLKLTDAVECKEVVQALRDEKLLTVPAGDNVIRILPPLTITHAEIDKGVAIIRKVLQRYEDATPANKTA
jgi:acetylornithine/N-succinyldiaminopimelate aminotransferase